MKGFLGSRGCNENRWKRRLATPQASAGLNVYGLFVGVFLLHKFHKQTSPSNEYRS